MKTTSNLMRVGALAAMFVGLSGFDGGCGWGGEPPTPLACEQLDESSCLADSRCEPSYARCACVMCVQGEGCPPCECPDNGQTFTGCHQRFDPPPPPPPPPTCRNLDEQTCLAHPECHPVYLETRCGQSPDGVDRCLGVAMFSSCEPNVCPALACRMNCPNGLAVDQYGCNVCACAPQFCSSDRECPSGERCLFAPSYCGTDASCLQAPGVCGPAEKPGCSSDYECGPGMHCVFPPITCPAGAVCSPPAGTCEPLPLGCRSDAECKPGQRCVFYETVCAPNMDCAFQMIGMCEDAPPPPPGCKGDFECAPGQVCRPDPSYVYMPWLAQNVCVSACDSLDERSCLSRPDCHALYGPRCGTPPVDPSDTGFLYCEPQACQPVMCEMWCEFGFQRDARGCEICACNPGPDRCKTDADCGANEQCVFASPPCDPTTTPDGGVGCAPSASEYGICVPRSGQCKTDADCASGERCVFPAVDCGAAADGVDGGFVDCYVEYGSCQPAVRRCADDTWCGAGERCIDGLCQPTPGCFSDAECGPGMRCDFGMVGCAPDAVGCLASGVCVPAQQGCASDADCAVGERCESMATCAAIGCPPAYNICVPATCWSDAECKPGQRCNLPDLICPPGTACPQPAGTCGPAYCTSDAQCSAGTTCQPDPTDPCNDPNVQIYCFAPGRMVCLPPPQPAECKSDADCAPGSSCQPDPTDPCNTIYNCFAPGRMICVAPSKCAALDERTCAAAPECKAVYGTCNWGGCDLPPVGGFHCETACKLLGEYECNARWDCTAVYAACPPNALCSGDMIFAGCQ